MKCLTSNWEPLSWPVESQHRGQESLEWRRLSALIWATSKVPPSVPSVFILAILALHLILLQMHQQVPRVLQWPLTRYSNIDVLFEKQRLTGVLETAWLLYSTNPRWDINTYFDGWKFDRTLFNLTLWQGLFFNSQHCDDNYDTLWHNLLNYLIHNTCPFILPLLSTIPLQIKVTNQIIYAKTKNQKENFPALLKGSWLPGLQCSDAMTSDRREWFWPQGWQTSSRRVSCCKWVDWTGKLFIGCSQRWPRLMISGSHAWRITMWKGGELFSQVSESIGKGKK